jgi:integral membrane sensor domain MASE1
LVVVLWWIGNVLLIFVVAPVCLMFLNMVLRPAKEIKAYAADVLEHGVALTGTLDSVTKLVRTKELTGTARQSVGRYGAALQRLL